MKQSEALALLESSHRDEIKHCLDFSDTFEGFLYHWDNFELSWSLFKPDRKDYEALSKAYKFEPVNVTHWFEQVKEVNQTKGAKKIQGQVCDIMTASLIVDIASKLNEQNKNKLMGLTFTKAGQLCWLLYGKMKNEK